VSIIPGHRPTFSSQAAKRLWDAGYNRPRLPWHPPTFEIIRRRVPSLPKWKMAVPPVEAPLPNFPSMRAIQDAVCEHFGLTLIELLAHRRWRVIVRARQVGMFLAKELTPRSHPFIATSFGLNDHSTVYHALKMIERLIAAGDPITADVEAIRAKLAVSP
jgi:hypothetical protein